MNDLTPPKKIFVANDHAGFELKKALMEHTKDLPWKNLGTDDGSSVDYPDYAELVAKEVTPNTVGVLICGSGQGMAIKANRYPHIRAALCESVEMAKLSRAHNNANVLCLGARFTPPELAEKILKTFLTTTFEGGRHEKRINKLS